MHAAGTGSKVPGRARVSLRDAIQEVRTDLRQLPRTLARAEAELFAPEARILEEIASRLLAREEAGAERDAVVAHTSCGCTDLVLDLRLRLLRALDGSPWTDLAAIATRGGDARVLVTDLVTPTLVVSLPREVVAVVGAIDESSRSRRCIGRNSHAAILARRRGLPLAYVSADALGSIARGSWVVVEVGEAGASVHVSRPRHP